MINKLDLMLQSHVIPTGEGFLGFHATLLLFRFKLNSFVLLQLSGCNSTKGLISAFIVD